MPAIKVIEKKNSWIWVTFQKEGIHCYPAAETDPRLNTGGDDCVKFLAAPHRHIFHFRVDISVTDHDREIEFIQFKRWFESLYAKGTLQLNFQSCEMLGQTLLDTIDEKYPNRSIKVSVSEDNENGAIVEKIREVTNV